MEAVIALQSGSRFQVKLGSGYALEIDTDKEVARPAPGARPMELMLASLGGCTASNLVGILRKSRHEVAGLEIRVTGERQPEPPMTFTRITLEYIIRGAGIDDDLVRRSLALSEKYCSAYNTLKPAVKIETTYRIEQV